MKYLKMTIALSFFVSMFSVSISASAEFKVGDKISNLIQSQDVEFDINLLDLGIGDNVGLKAETGIRVFPNQNLKTFSRVEPLKFQLDLQHTIPVGVISLSGKRTTTLSGEFVRQFKSQVDAFNVIKYPPYIIDNKSIVTNKRIPFTATQARELVAGDYFRYQVLTALTVSGRIGKDIGILNLNAQKSYVIYGDIQIEIYKKANQKVLVRASSLKQNEKSKSVNLSQNYILEIFESQILNSLADNLIPKDLVQFNIKTDVKGSLFAVEYEFDLNSSEAKNAYDQMMNYKNWTLKELHAVVSGSKEKAVNALMMRIADAEKRIALKMGDVERVSRSTTEFMQSSKGSSFNFRLVKGNKNSNYVEQNVSLVVDPSMNQRENFRITTLTLDESVGGLLLFKAGQEERREANVLFSLDSKMDIEKFLEMSFSYERFDKSFNAKNQVDAAGEIYKLVPGDLHGPGVRDFVQSLSKYHKDEVFVDIDLSFESKALRLANKLDKSEVEQVVFDYVNLMFDDQAIQNKLHRDFGNQELKLSTLSTNDSKPCNTVEQKVYCFQRTYKKDLEFIIASLPTIFRLAQKQQYESQWRLMVALQEKELFKKIGSGIISRLLMKAVLKEHNDSSQFYNFAKLRLHIRGRKIPATTFELGKNDDFEYINELLKIRNRILDREYDPSYFAESP